MRDDVSHAHNYTNGQSRMTHVAGEYLALCLIIVQLRYIIQPAVLSGVEMLLLCQHVPFMVRSLPKQDLMKGAAQGCIYLILGEDTWSVKE